MAIAIGSPAWPFGIGVRFDDSIVNLGWRDWNVISDYTPDATTAIEIITDYIAGACYDPPMSDTAIVPLAAATLADPKTYHHGNLVEALLAAAVELIEAQGVEKLSIRNVAKRVGVSPAAPFRHFRTKADLLTAVAEQSMARLTGAVDDALAVCVGADPISRLAAIGRGYLKWALGNPTHFQIISSRTLIHFEGSATLVEQNEAIRLLMLQLVSDAQAQGRIPRDVSAEDYVLNARAFAYGFARMATDGHFPEWCVTERTEVAADRALQLYLDMLTRRV